MITQLESDNLESKVKWALGSITTNKASKGDGIPAELFKILKDNAKKCSNYHTIAFISHASKVILKILQARFQQYINQELANVQAGFRKGKGTRDQIANSRQIIKKTRVPEKYLLFFY